MLYILILSSMGNYSSHIAHLVVLLSDLRTELEKERDKLLEAEKQCSNMKVDMMQLEQGAKALKHELKQESDKVDYLSTCPIYSLRLVQYRSLNRNLTRLITCPI